MELVDEPVSLELGDMTVQQRQQQQQQETVCDEQLPETTAHSGHHR